jgi:signal peptidase I
MITIGISVLEYITMAAAVTGICWLFARRQKVRAAQRKPLWVSWGAELFGVIALILCGRVALADWPQVPTGSMEPNIRVGDYLLVNKLAYGPRLPFTNTAVELGQPERSDVVVFRDPANPSKWLVKRLVGLPGDVVEFRDGVIRVNDEPFHVAIDRAAPRQPEDQGQVFLRESVAGHERLIKVNAVQSGGHVPPQAWVTKEAGACEVASARAWRCEVPAGRYLMMGDNRDNSGDSRIFGFVDHHEIYGKAVRVLVNFSDLSRAWTAL